MLYHLALRSFLIITLCIMALSSASCQQPASTEPAVRPKNIILLIGDGMGLTQMSSLFFGDVERIHFERFKHIGLIKTWSALQKVTDSAAAATAFASGVKSYNGALGVDTDTSRVETILEYAAAQGLRTGLIATSSITHATPAAFYAHVESRQMAEEIATHLAESPVDFFAGGGLQFFVDREDEIDYMEKLQENGFVMDSTALANGGLAPDQRYGFLLADDGMPRMLDGRGTFLPDAAALALEYLSAQDQGFFLMIEGSQIDWGGHANDAEYIVSEVEDFNQTVGIVLDFVEEHGETLVVVTADHETGGYTLASGESYEEVQGTFSTGGHSATLIPVYAAGPGAERFTGIYDNTEIYHKMMEAWGNTED